MSEDSETRCTLRPQRWPQRLLHMAGVLVRVSYIGKRPPWNRSESALTSSHLDSLEALDGLIMINILSCLGLIFSLLPLHFSYL